MRRAILLALVASVVALGVLLLGAASPDGPYSSPILYTDGGSTVSFPIVIPNNSVCALFLEVPVLSTAGDGAYIFRNIGLKNWNGSLTTYNSLSNLLQIGNYDTGLTGSSVSVVSGDAGTVSVVHTGVSGKTIAFQDKWTTKCMQP